MLETIFTRRAVIRANGDVDDFLALRIRNVSAGFCDLDGVCIIFPITEADNQYVSGHDSDEAADWRHGPIHHGLLVRAKLIGGIMARGERTLATHVLRRNRARCNEGHVQLDDPVSFTPFDGLEVVKASATAIFVFPESECGWTVSGAGALETTSRSVAWDFSYGSTSSPETWATATARSATTDPAILNYDDILAILHEQIGAELCNETCDYADLFNRIKMATHASVRESTRPLRLGLSRERTERLAQLESALSAMRKSRAAFSRSVASKTRRQPIVDRRNEQLASPSGAHQAPVRVFVSYAPADSALREGVEKHLRLMQRQGIISTWSSHEVAAGQPWQESVDEKLREAHVVLLLISVDFLASDYLTSEMNRALARHQKGVARVIPVFLRDCDYEGAPFAHLEMLPKNRTPVTMWPNLDAALADVARDFRTAVEALRGSVDTKRRVT